MSLSLRGSPVEVIDSNRDKDTEALMKWGAARARRYYVITPFRTVALIANGGVYMISRLQIFI